MNKHRWITLYLLLFSMAVSNAGLAVTENSPAGNGPDHLIGGTPAPADAYPWTVAVLNRRDSFDPNFAQFCGGSLIGSRWVLTSAFCVLDDLENVIPFEPGVLKVLIGESNLLGSGGELLNVDRVIVHQDFEWTESIFRADVALLHLEQPSSVAPVKFAGSPSNLEAPGTSVRLLGWGARVFDQFGSSDFPSRLQQLDSVIGLQNECADKWREQGFTVLDSQLCATSVSGGMCEVDEGGPVFVEDGGDPTLIAIQGLVWSCGDQEFPELYTRVSSYADWILEKMKSVRYFAQFGAGGGLSSDVVLFNASPDETATGEVQFRDKSGALIVASTILAEGSSEKFAIPPLGTVTVSTVGTGDLKQGSVCVMSDHDVEGVIRFQLPGIGIAGVGSSRPARSVTAPVRRQDGLNTGVAVVNLEASRQMVDVKLLAADGSSVPDGIASLDLEPGARVAQFLDELFPDVDTSDFRGMIQLSARAGNIAAIALELGSGEGEFTALPVSEVVQ